MFAASHLRSTQTSKSRATRFPYESPRSFSHETSSWNTSWSFDPGESRAAFGPDSSHASSAPGSASPPASMPHPCSSATSAMAPTIETRLKGSAKDTTPSR